eukprot:SAG11_NODE_6030_length_1405_cov_791.418836_1_plen_20_part_10
MYSRVQQMAKKPKKKVPKNV